MANEQNLILFNENTAREHGAKGGRKTGEAKRRRKRMREQLDILLSLPVENPDLREHIANMGIESESIDNQTAILVGLMREALKGNVAAAREVRSIVGEDVPEPLPDEIAPEWAGLPAMALGRSFVDVYRDIRSRGHRQYDFRGGRGSAKSSFCGLVLVDELERNPLFCAIAIRQVKDTIKDSVYAQIAWAIDVLGLTDKYYRTKSPMEIRRKGTGQVIYFRGADDPTKIKSLRPPKDMHIGAIWIEEADQLHGEEAMRSILQSTMRGGGEVLVFRSYNTPRSQKHFLNQEALVPEPSRLLHHSHYRDVPPEWLGDGFFEKAELLRKTNEKAYRHEYDGEAVGTGGMVFENIVAKEIPDSLIASFDAILNGVDWGYYPEPWTFNRMQFDRGSRTLYIFHEEEELKKSARETAPIVKALIRPGDIVTCDNREENCSDYRAFDISAQSAKKGPDSRKYSYEWLQSLNAIWIDPVRCPRTLKEFMNYEYERDKAGEIISGYPDGGDHHIDAVRYATERIWSRRGQ